MPPPIGRYQSPSVIVPSKREEKIKWQESLKTNVTCKKRKRVRFSERTDYFTIEARNENVPEVELFPAGSDIFRRVMEEIQGSLIPKTLVAKKNCDIGKLVVHITEPEGKTKKKGSFSRTLTGNTSANITNKYF
ncbi:hypothetical protein ACJMK2_041678 [Sinanodonta woodiana]|uniref:Uncharacterized protein n=1 Tax=Sinanodonta woodiana TaxID=1069815 RepID=A0ABD3W4W6_SINWO